MAVDLSDGVSTVPGDAVSKSLLSITDGNNALRIAVPGQVVDAAIDNAVFPLGDALADTIPYSHSTGGITTGDIESRGREPSDGCLGLVFGVLSGDCGVVDRTQKDGFVRL